MKSRVDEQKKSDNKLILRCLRDDLSLSVPLMKKENFIKRFLNQLELFFDIPSTVIYKRRNATETKTKEKGHDMLKEIRLRNKRQRGQRMED